MNEDEPTPFHHLPPTFTYGQSSFVPPAGTIWDLPRIIKRLFPHQIEAIEFMWKNLAGSIYVHDVKPGDGADTGGCVISHAPGTGKMLTAITFIQTYMKVFPNCRPIIFAPSVMLEGWEKEFRNWNVDIDVHNLCEPAKTKNTGETKNYRRLNQLLSWNKGNGVLLTTYNLFTNIAKSTGGELAELKKIILENAGLIIFDEGHTLRDENSEVFKALKEFKTSNRIILTGIPFQNNFRELYNILSLVRPVFGDRHVDTCDALTENITDDKNASKYGTVEEMQKIMDPFVHVYNGKILDNLPGSTECVIVLDPVPPQHKRTLERMKQISSKADLENDHRTSMVAIHPSMATCFNLSEDDKKILNVDLLQKLRMNPDDGVKTQFVIELIRLSISLNERVLVFCHYLEPLDMLKDQLVKLFHWEDGKEILKMVGKIRNQQTIIDKFNDKSSDARVMLASIKTCAEGISLVGASRVILIDVEWNPSLERQAISRAYRLGQTRHVYIYHLITYDTGEAEKYSKQPRKDLWSKLVFSPEIDFNNIKARSSKAEEEQTRKYIAQDKILDEMTANDKLKDIFIKICYQSEESSIRHVLVAGDVSPGAGGSGPYTG